LFPTANKEYTLTWHEAVGSVYLWRDASQYDMLSIHQEYATFCKSFQLMFNYIY